MSIFDVLAEERIRAALSRGELSGLPGEGRPLVFEDDCLVPAEARMTNKILRNAGYVPPALADLKELRTLAQSLATVRETPTAVRHMRRMTRLLLQLEAAGLSHVSSALLKRVGRPADLPKLHSSGEPPLK